MGKRQKQIAVGMTLAVVAAFATIAWKPVANYFQSGYEYDVIIPDGCHPVEPAPRFNTDNMPSYALPRKKMDIIIGCDGHEYIWPVEIGDSDEGYGTIHREDLKNLKRRS